MSLLLTVLVASLIGSTHCAGMCGAFAACAMGSVGGGGDRGGCGSSASARPSVLVMSGYHVGRLMTYCVMGGLAGLVGSALDLGGSMLGLRHAAAVLAGVTVLGVSFGLAFGMPSWFRVRLPARAERLVQSAVRRAMGMPLGRRALVIGLVTTLLPCGWLYAFVLMAAALGDPLHGVALMAAFWVGTVPVLSVVGLGAGRVLSSGSPMVRGVAALALACAGLWSVGTRFDVDLSSLEGQTPAMAAPASLDSMVELRDDLPCCHSSEGESSDAD